MVMLDKAIVNGPVYEEIIQEKELVADILPSLEYVLESWQVAWKMLVNSAAELS